MPVDVRFCTRRTTSPEPKALLASMLKACVSGLARRRKRNLPHVPSRQSISVKSIWGAGRELNFHGLVMREWEMYFGSWSCNQFCWPFLKHTR